MCQGIFDDNGKWDGVVTGLVVGGSKPEEKLTYEVLKLGIAKKFCENVAWIVYSRNM